MNRNKAVEKAIQQSIGSQSNVVVYEKGFSDYGVVERERFYGEEDLVVNEFCCGEAV